MTGVRTTIPVLQRIMADADFRAGRLSTAFLDRFLPGLRAAEGRHATIAMIAAALVRYEGLGRGVLAAPASRHAQPLALGPPRLGRAGHAAPATTSMKFVATLAGQSHALEITGAGGRYRVTIGDQVWDVDARFTSGGVCSLLIGGASYTAGITEQDGTILVDVGGESYAVEIEEAIRHAIRTRGGSAAGGAARTLTAPLPGRVTHVAVRAGDRVGAGDTLLVIEAMKMENEFKATAPGRWPRSAWKRGRR